VIITGKLGWERGEDTLLIQQRQPLPFHLLSQLFSRSPVTGADMVRNATAGDIPALIELGTRMYIESRYSQNSPFDEEKCAELARSVISPAGCLLVAKKTVL
jgi:cytochrome c peroxidase